MYPAIEARILDMASILTIYDQTLGGMRGDAMELSFPSERITVRELIRARVYQEVKEHNARKISGVFRGLVQPSDAEVALNGYRLRRARTIDWEKQLEVAIAAFERNEILVLVDDKQANSLAQEIVIEAKSELVFLKLVPLVGG